MKFVMILLLCGVAWSTPEETPDVCSPLEIPEVCLESLTEADREALDDVAVDEEALNLFCKVQMEVNDCKKQQRKTCVVKDLERYIAFEIHYRNIVNKICSDSDPFRKSFLDTIPCIMRVTNSTSEECKDSSEDYCKSEEIENKCIETHVHKECGEAAKDMFCKLTEVHSSCP